MWYQISKDGYKTIEGSKTVQITPRTIAVNVTIKPKDYDGLNTAEISAATLNGVIWGATVGIATPYPTATFANVGAANNIAVSFGGNFTLTGADAGNYTLTQPSATGNITNTYHAAKDTDYTISHTGWSNTDFVVTAKAGFELSLQSTAGGTWSDSLTKSDETANGSLAFYVRNKTTGAISLAASESYKIDKTAPTGDIKMGTSSIRKLLNTITFGLFFKETKSITIDSADSGSDVASVSYILSSTILEEAAVEEISDWTAYTGTFTIEQNSKTVVYAKITDNADNVVYMGSDGLVLFTDSTASTESISFTKTSTADKIATVNLNGNTVKELSIGENTLTKNTDYTVSGDEITLKASYLNTLPVGNHTVVVSFYPLGETGTPNIMVPSVKTEKSKSIVNQIFPYSIPCQGEGGDLRSKYDPTLTTRFRYTGIRGMILSIPRDCLSPEQHHAANLP